MGVTLTVLGAVSLSGWVAVMSVEAATEAAMFSIAYLKHVLCPQLKPGQLVVMDNLGAHKVDGVRELIQQSQALLSATCHPIHRTLTPSKSGRRSNKSSRALKARSVTTLPQALDEALPTLTPENAANYFRHCGYPL